MTTKNESTQPQLPPRPEFYVQVEGENHLNSGYGNPHKIAAVAITYMNALEAENESLKARLMQVDDVLVVNWITVEDGDYREALHKLIKYNIAIHDDPAVSEVAANRKAERDKALEVIREYREDHLEASIWSAKSRDCDCPTCIKADELLKERP